MNTQQVPQEYERALADAVFMMDAGCEPRSALKEAAISYCIPILMSRDFMDWAEAKLLSE